MHGIDIVEVSRIKDAIENTKGFKEKVFTEKEIIYCEAKKDKYPSFAARFAAKEAYLKAIGTGLSNGLKWTDIEIAIAPLLVVPELASVLLGEVGGSGKPTIQLYDKAKEIADKMNITNISVSLSHTAEIAIASVIIQ